MPKKVSAAPAPIKNKDGSVTLYLLVAGCTPEGVQYKPYSTHFTVTSPVYVPVNVGKQFIVSYDPLIVSPEGWFTVAKRMATASVIAAGAQS